jgi:hypothetical protein
MGTACLGSIACSASPETLDASFLVDTGTDAALDAVPPPPDTGECGTIGQSCTTEEDCTEGLHCARGLSLDAGVEGLCLPVGRGSCGGLAGETCPVETDECVSTPLADDVAFCFESSQLRCSCAWPPFAEWYRCP